MKWYVAFLLLSISLLWNGSEASELPTAEIEIKHLSEDHWQVTWEFSEPVEAFRVYPPRLGFRTRSWILLSDGFSIDETDEGAVFSNDGALFDSLEIQFKSDAQFDSKTYVPVLPFSDGGAAIYSGHFSGDILKQGEWFSTPSKFKLLGLEGEKTLLPSWIDESKPVYVYFGKQEPIEADQVVMIADDQMPQWLQDVFTKSVPAVTSMFSEQLGFKLTDKPLVFISAGELQESDGYSVKGAGLDGQFTVMLKGKDLLTGTKELELMFQKMLAHELLHIWQQAMPGGDFNPEQAWLHEGSADALAVHALYKAGVWSKEELEDFHEQQKNSCTKALGTSSLASAANAGNWTAIYSCGYLEFTEGIYDPFLLWRQLTGAANEQGMPYTQHLLESIRKDKGL
jgi:hypothetical protein